MRNLALSIAILCLGAGAHAHPITASSWGDEWVRAVDHGDSHLVMEEYAWAMDAYERAMALAPHASEGYVRAAVAAYRWGDAIKVRRSDLWIRALELADRARFLDPYSGEAAFLAGVIRYRLGDYRGAIDVYAALERVRKGDIELYLDLALAAKKLGDNQLALLAFQAARSLDPTSPRLLRVARELVR